MNALAKLSHLTVKHMFLAALLLGAMLFVCVLLLPAGQAPNTSPPSLRPDPEYRVATTMEEGPQTMERLTTATASLSSSSTPAHKEWIAPCDTDPDIRTLQQYRKLSAHEWRSLNQWQQERGLSQTRLRADQELMQEPSPYLYYDTDSLQAAANNSDADAQYWLAMKYREQGAVQVKTANGTEDAQLEIARLLQQAANAGHVQAMLAISQSYYEQRADHSGQDYPDQQIRARAWTRIAAWRLGHLADAGTALPTELEAQAAQLANQLISDMQQQRHQLGLPPFNNVVPDAVISLLHAASAESCRRIAQARPATRQLAEQWHFHERVWLGE